MTKYKDKALTKVKTVRGQLDAIINMLEEDRYCLDISTQLLSCIGQLKKANIDILEGHMKTCVKTAIENNEKSEEKINEIVNILDKYLK